ncbi:TPA: XdhC family protein [Clostridioides difficile]
MFRVNLYNIDSLFFITLIACFIHSASTLPPPTDENSYIIILTRGHLYDSSALEWALKRETGYIGMIGSRTKIGLTYEKLMKKGFKKEELSKVHAPIGIKLNAQTPAEIAVCIAAELINCRANKEK